MTSVARAFVGHQLPQEQSIAAADFYYMTVSDISFEDDVTDEFVQIIIKRWRAGLRVVIVGAVHGFLRVKSAIEDETAAFTNDEGQIASRGVHCRRLIAHQQVLVHGHLPAKQKLSQRLRPADRTDRQLVPCTC